jgi:hypothetical protein
VFSENTVFLVAVHVGIVEREKSDFFLELIVHVCTGDSYATYATDRTPPRAPAHHCPHHSCSLFTLYRRKSDATRVLFVKREGVDPEWRPGGHRGR